MLVGCPTTAYSDFMQGNSTLTVVNRAVKHNPLWLCSTEVAIPEDQRFENLVIVQEEVEDMMLVTSDVDFKVNSRFLLQAYHARVDLQSVEATKFRIALDDGSLKFSLDGNPENYDFRNRKALVVQSGSAMLTIENSIPVDLQLSKDVMSRTFVRAQHIDVEENWVSGTQAVTLIASPHEFGMSESFILFTQTCYVSSPAQYPSTLSPTRHRCSLPLDLWAQTPTRWFLTPGLGPNIW